MELAWRQVTETLYLEEIEEGGRKHADAAPMRNLGVASSRVHRWAEGTRNFCSFFLGPVFVQAFVLTFLGEWGDRSQIATIALGAAHVRFSRLSLCVFADAFCENVYLVTLGTVIGHSMCTALAVIGGRYVSTKISVKHGAF
jgi:Ca2+/H+ antiporter, TMEM165/GDT1 family